MFKISVNFKDTKKVDPILESLLDVQSFFDALYFIYSSLEIKEIFIGTPFIKLG